MTNREFHQELYSDYPLYEELVTDYDAKHRKADEFFAEFSTRANALVGRVLYTNLCHWPSVDVATTNSIGMWIIHQRFRRKLRSVQLNLYRFQHHATVLERVYSLRPNHQNYYASQVIYVACGLAAKYIDSILS